MEQNFTEAARRALARAAEHAVAEACPLSEPRHLLWALVELESRAAEILAKHGIDRGLLEQEFPSISTRPSAGEPDTFGDNATPYPGASAAMSAVAASESLRCVIVEAQRQAGVAGRHVEVGSEHLLGGLGVVESEVSHFLGRQGLVAESLVEKASDISGFSTAPIETDLQWKPRSEIEIDRVNTLRIVDAAANRLREGLRVVEDFTRFALDDLHLTEELKKLRHGVTASLAPLGLDALLAARETQHDVGTHVSLATERVRATPLDVVRANLKRVQESARTLEEYAKVVDPQVAAEIEQLRYAAYTLERAVLSSAENQDRLAGRNLYLLVTESLCHHGAGPAIRNAIAGGVGIVQIREKGLPDRALIAHGQRVREWTRDAGVLLIMNDRPDLALLIEADGVHLGQDDMSVHQARRIVGPDRLIGVSTHSIGQARQAVLDGADYLGVGPVFSSQTKNFDKLAGLSFVRQVAAEISLPWYAIGGINHATIAEAIGAGARRFAVSHAICAAEDPGRASAALVHALT